MIKTHANTKKQKPKNKTPRQKHRKSKTVMRRMIDGIKMFSVYVKKLKVM